MRPQSAKQKGRRFQQWVRDQLKDRFDLHEDDIRSNPMGAHGEDVWMSPAARTQVPYSIECKNVEKLSIWSAIEQTRENCGGHTPAVAFTKNREDEWMAIPMSDFLTLLDHANKWKRFRESMISEK